MARRGEEARRGEGSRGAFLPARHRHGRRIVGARRRCAVLRFRRRAGHAARQPPPGQFLRRQAQDHDARIFDRAQQARTERKLPRQSRRHAQAHSAALRRHRAGDAERHDRRCHRRDEIPGAAMASAGRRPLHRHRLLQHHARSGRRLDQLRHLPGHDPRRKIARLLHLARQARPPDARQVRRARRAHAGRDRLRRRSDELPHGIERSAVRRERARGDRRHARPARRGDQGPGHRPADPGQRRDRDRGFRRARQRARRRPLRRMDRLLRQRLSGPSR